MARPSAALLALMAMGRLPGIGFNSKAYRKEPKAPKMSLTDEEQAQLKALNGKAKKAYVKDLKAKYGEI